MGKEDLPSLKETIAIIRVEGGRRGVTVLSLSTESSTMVSKGMKNSNPDQQQFGGSNEQSDFSKSIKAKIKIPCGTPTAKGLTRVTTSEIAATNFMEGHKLYQCPTETRM